MNFMALTTTINMTIKQVIMHGGIPFDVALPKDDDLLKYFTEKELEDSAKELAYMEKHLDEYKSYDNVNDLKKALLNDD